ncbi:MAG: hypothetical protein K2H87_07990 [Duncaniella sp.]|nr:hypothetical protein [Duncaniella sp.]
MRSRPLLLILAPLSLGMTGCFFTGVESTPPITSAEVRREVPPATREDTLLARFGDAPLGEWKPGKELTVTDPRIALIFDITPEEGEALDGHTLLYRGLRESSGVTGTGVTDLVFGTPGGTRDYLYRINRPASAIMQSGPLSVPFTLQPEVAREVDKVLRGRRLYILTSVWRDDSDTPVKGRKFVPVTVDSVSPGNLLFPLKVAFTDDRGTGGRIFMHPGAKDTAPRTFSDIFAVADPRLKYPNVSDEHWELITLGRVHPGMSTLECRLALGAPKEVLRGHNGSYLRETWTYDNGRYLRFEDGLLVGN